MSIKHIFGKTAKVFGYIIGSILLLFVLVWVALQFPQVQTFAVHKATNYLSKKLNTTVAIKEVDIKFFKTVVLRGIYVEDLKGDTLIYAGQLEANVGVLALSQKRITLNLIGLENAVVNFTKAKGEKEYNYAFIPRAFASDTTQKDTTAGKWEFDLEDVELANVRFNVDDAVAENNLHVKVKALDVALRTLGLEEKHIQAKNIDVDQLNFEFRTRAAKDTAFIADSLPKRIEELGTKEVIKPFNPSGYLFTVDNFEVHNSNVKYVVVNAPTAKKGMIDYKNINLQHLNIDIEDVDVGVNSLTGEVKQFAFNEHNSGFALNELALELNLDMPRLQLKLHDFRTPNSEMDNGVEVNVPSIKNLKNILAELEADIEWDNDSLAVRDLEYFTEALSGYKGLKGKKIYLNGDISAREGTYDLNDLDISVDPRNYLRGEVEVRGFYPGFYKDKNGFKKLYAEVNIEELRTDMYFINQFLPPGTLSPELHNAGSVVVAANVQGKVQDMAGDVSVRSAFGNVNSDFRLRADNNFDRKDITAHVEANNVNLEKFLGRQAKLGKVTLVADIEGMQSSQAMELRKGKVLVNSLVYNNYTYKDLRANGSYINNVGKASVDYNDANLQIDLDALANMNGRQPGFSVEGLIGKADLRRLNFTTDTLVVSTAIDADVHGKTPDAMVGTVSLRNTKVTKGRQTLPLDSLTVMTNLDSGYRNIELNSDVMTAVVSGKFTFTGIGVAMQDYVQHYFSMYKAPAHGKISDQSLTFNVHVKQNPKLLQMLVSGLQVPKPVTLQGNFDSKGYVLNFSGDAPLIRFKDKVLNGLAIKAVTENERLNLETSAASVALNDTTSISKPSLRASMESDNLNFNVRMSAREDTRANLNGKLGFKRDTFLLTFDPSEIVYKNTPVRLRDDAVIVYAPNHLVIKDLELIMGPQRIMVNTHPMPGKKVMLRADIDNLVISKMMPLVPVSLPYRLDGVINGHAIVYDLFNIEKIESDLKVGGFKVDDNVIGDIALDANQVTKTGLLSLDLGIKGDHNDIAVNGTYNTNKNAKGDVMNLRVDLRSVNTKQFVPFIKEFVSDMAGIITADLTVKGTPENPRINGNIRFGENAMIQPKMLHVPFKFNNQVIVLDGSRVVLDKFTIMDDTYKSMVINGNVNFADLDRIALDLKMYAEQFHLMNSGYSDNETFYGKAYITSNLRLKGEINNLEAIGVIRTEPGTDLYLPIGGKEREVKRADYISFVGDSLNQPPTEKKKKASTPSSFALNAKIKITPETRFTVIIDPNTGDQLQCSGEADLRIGIAPSGDINLQGTYELTEGHYAMNLFGMVKRRLEIEKGSTITWTGLPTDGIANITTVYQTKASRYELISDQQGMLSKAEERTAKAKLPVYVYVKMKGTLLKPDLSFDIKIPEEEQASASGQDANAVIARLNQIRANQSELLKQVFGLIAFNRFINDGSLMAGGGSTNESINAAVDESLSDVLTKQLNNISGDYLGGLEFTVAMESNNANSSAEQALTNKNVNIGVSKQFLNDRMRVTIGSTFNTGSGANTSNQNNVGFNSPNRLIGDVTVEYRLNPSGNLNLKFFRLYQQNIYSPNGASERMGASIAHTRDFDSFRGLFFRGKKQKINREARREEEVTATANE